MSRRTEFSGLLSVQRSRHCCYSLTQQNLYLHTITNKTEKEDQAVKKTEKLEGITDSLHA